MAGARNPSVEETLAKLGIEELRERMEVSPLLATDGLHQDPGTEGSNWMCCSCKLPPDPDQPTDSPPLPPERPE